MASGVERVERVERVVFSTDERRPVAIPKGGQGMGEGAQSVQVAQVPIDQLVGLIEQHLSRRHLSLAELWQQGYGTVLVEVTVQDGRLLISRVNVGTSMKPSAS